MEVNVDLLDQMELVDVSDQETLDVFFSSGGEEGLLTSPLPGMKADDRLKGLSLLLITNNTLCLTRSARPQKQRGSHQSRTLPTRPRGSRGQVPHVLHVLQLVL